MYTNLKDGGYTERAESYLRRLLDKDKKDNLLLARLIITSVTMIRQLNILNLSIRMAITRRHIILP